MMDEQTHTVNLSLDGIIETFSINKKMFVLNDMNRCATSRDHLFSQQRHFLSIELTSRETTVPIEYFSSSVHE
jgi:hypothetical protein